MKKALTLLACSAFVLASCGGNQQKAAEAQAEDGAATKVTVAAHDNVPEYTYVNNPQIDLSQLEKDEDGYYILFNGKDFTGWRGYMKDHVPTMWTVEDGCIKFNGKGGGEAQQGDGGDIIFTHMFKNFEFKFEWKVEKGANSGVFYLAREVEQAKEDGTIVPVHIYCSCPEYQILDNANHPDAKLGKTMGIRQSSSLYDMIIADPQNANPYGEWNSGSIMVYQGTVVHGQNEQNVLEYHMWTPEWTDLLNSGKFASDKWPIAFDLLNNCGGPEHAGYIGFQDHGDVVYYRNIKIKVYDEE